MGRLQRFVAIGGSMRNATWMLLTLAMVTALGSLVPQAPIEPDLRSLWNDGAVASLGPLARVLSVARLTRFYHSAWFWLPGFAVLLAVAACTWSRWRLGSRSPTHVTHLAVLVLAGGVMTSVLTAHHRTVVASVGGPPVVLDGGSRSLTIEIWTGTAGAAGPAAGIRVVRADGSQCAGTARPGHPLRCGATSYVLVGAVSDVRGEGAGPLGTRADPASTSTDVAARGVEVMAVHDCGYWLVIASLACLTVCTASSLWRPRRFRCRNAEP